MNEGSNVIPMRKGAGNTTPVSRQQAIGLVITADAMTYGLRSNEDDIADVKRVDSLQIRVCDAFESLGRIENETAAELARSVIAELTDTQKKRE